MDIAKRIKELRIFNPYGDIWPYFGGLGGGQTHFAGIYPAVDRVSVKV